MLNKLLDFEKIIGQTLEESEPLVSHEQLASPCAENQTVRDLLRALPTTGSGHEFARLIRRLAQIRRVGRPVILGIGGDVLDAGVSPVIIDLMRRSLISGVALSSQAAFKDVGIAVSGGVVDTLGVAPFDFFKSRDIGEIIRKGINYGAKEDMGLGESLVAYLAGKSSSYGELSLIVAAGKWGVPLTVHPAIGTDIVHFLPGASGEALGKTAHLDFCRFATLIADLQGGAYINSCPSQVLPRVFLKALLAARTLGRQVDDYSLVFLGWPLRPEDEKDWQGLMGDDRVTFFDIQGAVGLLYPLLASCLLDEFSENC